MKSFLLLATALAFGTGIALAQTTSPGSIPGALSVTPAEASDAGSPRGHRRTDKVPGMSHSDKKRLRKLVKVPTNPEGTQKAN